MAMQKFEMEAAYLAQRQRVVDDSLRPASFYMMFFSGIGLLVSGLSPFLGLPGNHFLMMTWAALALMISALANFRLRRSSISKVESFILVGSLSMMPTGFIMINHFFTDFGSLSFLFGPVGIMYFVIIIFAAFFFDDALVWFCSALCSIGYFLCFVVGSVHLSKISLSDPILQADLTDPIIHFLRCLVIFLSGPILIQFSRVGKKLMFNVLEEEREKNKTSVLLAEQKRLNSELESAYSSLKATQEALLKSERMATIGQVSLDIAHEVQNPLNFIINFSEINKDIIEDLREEVIVEGPLNSASLEDFKTIEANTISIHDHGKRVAKIVSGLLDQVKLAEKGQAEIPNHKF